MAALDSNLSSKKVWTSLITNLDYIPGLLTLNYSLKKVNSHYVLVALYTDNFPDAGRRALEARGIPTRRVDVILPSKGKDYSNDPRFYDCWSKLATYGLFEYDRIVALDSDMLVLQNMDELMDLELDSPELGGTGARVFAAGHACVCNPLKRKHYPREWIPANCAFTSQHADPETAQTTGADPSVGPLGCMNSGLQVINPSRGAYEKILAYLESDAVANMDFSDQSLLEDLFRGSWVPLPYVYNALKTLRQEGVHSEIWRDDRVKNVHYILSPKPWEILNAGQGAMEEAVKRDPTMQWWFDGNGERLRSEAAEGLSKDGY